MIRIGILTALLSVALSMANAQQTPIDISAEANTTWCNEIVANCASFPFGMQRYDGVSFSIPGDNNTANDVWAAADAAGGGSAPVSVTVPINLPNIRTVYTLMNTNWGSTQSGLLSITFTAADGTTWTSNLLGNVEIRDHNQGSFTNDISCQLPNGTERLGVVNAWTNNHGQRLDMQVFELPSSFKGQTLTSLTINDNGNENVQRSFLAAVTVSTRVP